MRFLVIGGAGQVGHELVRELVPLGQVTAPSLDQLDLTVPSSVKSAVRELRPDVIVNAAAYTAVDRAEQDPVACHALNAAAPALLAEEALRGRAVLVHYSTDYVYDGRSERPYIESDAPGPLNVYGTTKLAGDEAIAAVGGSYLILRTSWVYGARGTNFLRTMRRLFRERQELCIVSDQVGAPTWSRAIAAATAQILAGHRGTAREEAFDLMRSVSGVYHLTAAGSTSWFDFARTIRALDPDPGSIVCERIVPITTEEFGAPAKRPPRSILDNRKLHDTFGVRLPDWEHLLKLVIQDLQ